MSVMVSDDIFQNREQSYSFMTEPLSKDFKHY